MKLYKDVNLASWFAPAKVKDLNVLDIDLGSAGPMLLPRTTELVGGGKQGIFYLLDQKAHSPHVLAAYRRTEVDQESTVL